MCQRLLSSSAAMYSPPNGLHPTQPTGTHPPPLSCAAALQETVSTTRTVTTCGTATSTNGGFDSYLAVYQADAPITNSATLISTAGMTFVG